MSAAIRFPRAWQLAALALMLSAPASGQETAEPVESETVTATPEETAPAEGTEPESTPADVPTVAVENTEAAPPAAPGVTQLDDIVVTSQKRVQSIQDVPISVTALTGQMMFENGVTDVREALQLTPNARVDSAGFFAAPRIRGFTLNNNNKSFEPPVGMVFDGIPHTRIEYFMAALMDTARLEVMRGPQGTSFGKNTTAGLIHMISNDPGNKGGFFTLEGGELDRQRLEGAYGGSLTDGLDFRVSGLLDRRDGFIENTTADVLQSAPDQLKNRDRTGLRTMLEAPDVFGSKLLFAYEQYHLYDGGAALESIVTGPAFRDAVRGYDPGADFTPGNWIHSQDFDDFRDVTIRSGRFQLDRDVGDWELVVLGAHSILDQTLALDTDFTPAAAVLGTGKDHSPESYGEIRFTAPTFDGLFGMTSLGTSDFLFGFSGGRRQILDSHFTFGINNKPFWDLTSAAAADVGQNTGGTGVDPGSIGSTVGAPQDPTTAASEDKFDEMDQLFEQTSDELSGFAHLQWHFLPKWSTEFGARYTTEKKDGYWDLTFTTPEPNTTLRAVGAAPFIASRELKFNNVQPKVSVGWEPMSDLSVFLHWERGYKAGGFNAFAFRQGNDPVADQGFEDDDLTFRDEVATNIGLDFKSWWFGHTANVNLSFFRETAQDFQVLIRENPQGTVGLGTSRVTNAEEALAQGIELDVRWLVTDWLNLMSGIGVLDTEFIKFTKGECPVGNTKKDSDDDGDPACAQDGKPFPFAPELSGTLAARVTLPMDHWPLIGSTFAGLAFAAGTVVEYETTQLLDIDLDEKKRQDAFTRVKADLGVSSLARRWTVRVVAENINDAVTWVRMGDVFEDVVVGSQNQPRLVYLQFRQDF